jgi:uncharacterized metal-binding protein YceD (DUF177 family)
MNDIIDFNVIDEDGPQRYQGTWSFSASDISREEIVEVGNVTLDVTVQQGDSAGEYAAKGTASLTADLTCSRCVEPYPFANVSTFHVRFRPRPEVSAENEEIEITNEEELDVEFYSDRSIPLRELALEQVQLAVPMKPLCDEGCLGLCPQCGANRTRERCSCDESVVDERWGALKGLREQLAKKQDV